MPWKLLLLDAEDALSRDGTRLAVILGQTAIEGAVSELLIRKFLEKRPSLVEVHNKLRVREALSYESAVEKAGIDQKLSSGFKLTTGSDIKTDTILWYEWDVANATRVSCVYHGHSPPLKHARTVLNTYWRIYREHLEGPLMNEAASAVDWIGDCINALTFGSLYTAFARHKDAYKTGVKLAGSVLSKKIPFGTVLIAVGQAGLSF